LIELRNVYKSYGSNEILKNINLSLESGEITFIVGTSGTGKSTLLNLIGGLDKVTSGTILLNNEDIKENLNEYRAKKVGFIFQDFNLVTGLTVKKNIELAMDFSGESYSETDIITKINSLGIKNIHQKAETLSGGEKQRVAIIRSICKNSNVIIADEPTGNLDSDNADLVLDLLTKMKKDKHIIIVSHDMEKAQKYGDRIITLKDGEIISDNIQTKEDVSIPEEFKDDTLKSPENKHNLRKSVFMLGENSIRVRKGKILSIAFVLAIAISSLAMVINFNRSGNELSHNVNVNYLENDLINLYFNATPNAGDKETPFSDEDINAIKNKYEPREVVSIYRVESSSWLFSVESETTAACIKQINMDDFFKERVMSNEIDGDFMTNSNEIILAEDVAKALFDGDCIGKTISLNDGMGQSVELVIVGVNHTVNPFDKIYSFVSNLKIKELLDMQMQSTLYERMEVNKFYNEKQVVSSGGFYGGMREYSEDVKILNGERPDTITEIMISSELAKYAYDSLSTSDSVPTELFSKELVINFNGVFNVKICGIYEFDKIEMIFTNQLITELQKVDPIGVDIYLAKPDDVTSIKESINTNEKYAASTQLENLKDNVTMQTRFFSLALILIGIIFLLISISLLSSFSKIAVLERKKEVAIIKSLGASNRNVLFVLLFDSGIISLLAFVLSLFFYGILNTVLPYIMPKSSVLDYGYPVFLLIGINLIFALLVIVYTRLNMRNLVKKMPAELFVQQ